MGSTDPNRRIQPGCFHPSGVVGEFLREEVELSVHVRFEKIADRFPDRLAVKQENQEMTYAELNALANRIAHAILMRQGVGAEAVGLWMENGSALAAAMLGVLKAGKFCVVLDPLFPQSRIAAVLEDSQARLLIGDRQNLSSMLDFASPGCRVLEIESIDHSYSSENPSKDSSSSDVATLFYTSGSTGKPKGVVCSHRDMLHRTRLRTSEDNACPYDRIALLPAGTANAVTNILFALLNGAALLPFDVRRQGPARLSRWLREEKISICAISSPLFRTLCETLTGEEWFPDLRILRLRSETVFPTDVDLYKRNFPRSCLLVTGLSSSETGLLTTYVIDHNSELGNGEVPVGYAVEDREILRLDENGRELGFDQVGEIVVRSRYLALGYWRNPELTQAKFNGDPEGDGERLYYTGDLGLMRPDGCLIHKGRKDFRVKIRGFGVETAEVEKALLQHGGVREAVVVAQPGPSGEARLVAYIVPGQIRPGISELRKFLTQKFPDYMTPAFFVMLKAFPLTASGKVDRAMLPPPARTRPDLEATFVSPRTVVEEGLAGIWAETLGLDVIGVHDNFFDLGGHSLAATRVISRVMEKFQMELPIQTLFQSPTVAAMAEVIGKNQGHNGDHEDLLLRTLRDLESLTDEQTQEILARMRTGDKPDSTT